MGIALRLRGASGATTCHADTVVIRFDESGLCDLDLTNDGQSAYAGGPIPARQVGDLEGTDAHGFKVVVQDRHGGEQGPFPAHRLDVGFPLGYEVGFGQQLKETDEGLVGEMKGVKLANGGHLLVEDVHVRDG